MHEQKDRQRSGSLPYRLSPKDVLFSAVVMTDNEVNSKTISRSTHVTGLYPATSGYLYSKEGNYVFDSVPTLIKTPWEYGRRPANRWSWPSRNSVERTRQRQRQQHQPLPTLFDRLPQTVNHLILTHVQELHEKSPGVCADCLLRNMHNLSLICKTWHEATNSHMYQRLWLPGSHQGSRGRRRNRLRLLLRTLQGRPDLASQVLRLYHPPVMDENLSDQERDNLTTELADVILACPNIEACVGLYRQYCSGELPGKLTAALATRGFLKEHLWLLEGRGSSSQAQLQYFKCHEKWTNLETLVIREGGPFLGPGSMYCVLRQLPALHHLALIGLSPASFHDGTLQALTGLRSLRLEALQGLTDLGLQQSLPKTAASLQSLSLVDLDIKSLRTISHILGNFAKLCKLVFVQDGPPGLPLGADVTLAKELPLLSSPSLTYLHWETLMPGSANQALENSIRKKGFPCLRTLRVPCDSDGSLQSLCRPLARRQLTEQQVKAYELCEAKGYTRDLSHARTAAQLRIRGSRHTPAVSVVVQDDDNHVQHTHVIGKYLGDIQSQIAYDLEPDFEGISQALGRIEDVIEGKTFACPGSKKGRKSHAVRRQRELQSLF